MDVITRIQSALAERYRVVHEVGAGGMASVYLAHDVKHDRQVALKVLRPELGAALGPERFLSEIRVTASLQHPHLVPLFDSGEVDGLLFYVMPYVQGESLAQRLEREVQLPVDEAIRITLAVASALDYAHRHNVIHRDLKPANILLHDGQPLVSDFGIALAVSKAGGARMTQTGWSMGTPQYMSPEQASGERLIDARSDIYSLGAVLYEMLSGEPPHAGQNAQVVVARVLAEHPRSLQAMRPTVPEHVDVAVGKALAKLPADRFATAQQFADALQNPRSASLISHLATDGDRLTRRSATSSPGWRRRALALTPWLFAVLGLAVAARTMLRQAPPNNVPVARFALTAPVGVTAAIPGAVSPAGNSIVFFGVAGAMGRLYVRDLQAMESRDLPGTNGARDPFFSWDGATIGFFDGARLRRLAVSGVGRPVLIATTKDFGGATWGPDDAIVYSGGSGEGLWRVAATGGEPHRLTRLDSTARERAHVFPHFLPDGQAILFTILGDGDPQLAVATMDGRIRKLGYNGSTPHYVHSGHLLFATPDGSLLAAPFNARRLIVSGQPTKLIEGVRMAGARGLWSASPNGVLVFSRGDQRTHLVLVDRDGHAERLAREARIFRMPRFAPDGNRIAVEVWAGPAMGNSDIWLFDRRTEALSRFTSGEGNIDPVWTPDGRALTYARMVEPSNADIYVQRIDGGDSARAILTTPGLQWPWSWTPDAETLLYDDVVSNTASRIMALDLGGGATRPVVETEYLNVFGRLSPDGRWLAYTSNESGRMEVYVKPFTSGGSKVQISVGGGNYAVWSRDGRELFYRDGRREYMPLPSTPRESSESVRATSSSRETSSSAPPRTMTSDQTASTSSCSRAWMPRPA